MDERLKELLERLVAPGPAAAGVSASEFHEIYSEVHKLHRNYAEAVEAANLGGDTLNEIANMVLVSHWSDPAQIANGVKHLKSTASSVEDRNQKLLAAAEDDAGDMKAIRRGQEFYHRLAALWEEAENEAWALVVNRVTSGERVERPLGYSKARAFSHEMVTAIKEVKIDVQMPAKINKVKLTCVIGDLPSVREPSEEEMAPVVDAIASDIASSVDQDLAKIASDIASGVDQDLGKIVIDAVEQKESRLSEGELDEVVDFIIEHAVGNPNVDLQSHIMKQEIASQAIADQETKVFLDQAVEQVILPPSQRTLENAKSLDFSDRASADGGDDLDRVANYITDQARKRLSGESVSEFDQEKYLLEQGVNRHDVERRLTERFLGRSLDEGHAMKAWLDEMRAENLDQEPDAAVLALNAIAELCGCPEWDYPGQVVRDVKRMKIASDRWRREAQFNARAAKGVAALGDAIKSMMDSDLEPPLLEKAAGELYEENNPDSKASRTTRNLLKPVDPEE